MGFSVEFLGVNIPPKSLEKYLEDGTLLWANSSPDHTANCLIDNLMEGWLRQVDPFNENGFLCERGRLRERLIRSLIRNGIFESLDDKVLPSMVFIRVFETSPEMTENVLAVFRNAM